MAGVLVCLSGQSVISQTFTEPLYAPSLAWALRR